MTWMFVCFLNAHRFSISHAHFILCMHVLIQWVHILNIYYKNIWQNKTHVQFTKRASKKENVCFKNNEHIHVICQLCTKTMTGGEKNNNIKMHTHTHAHKTTKKPTTTTSHTTSNTIQWKILCFSFQNYYLHENISMEFILSVRL